MLLRYYDANGRKRARAELEWFRSQASLEAAVRFAAVATDERGKRYSHQRRISGASLDEGGRRLASRIAAIRKTHDFDKLFRLISDAVDGVRGLGELWRYDTALRIGVKLDVLPELVYLHAGTRVGAARIGLDARAKTLKPETLPEALRGLPPHEVEDILCIYKTRLPSA